MRAGRAHDRNLLLAALQSAGLLPPDLEPALNGQSPMPLDLPPSLCSAAHALLARASSRLVAVQIEDLVGMQEQANVPGTMDEHPNWRRKLPVNLDEIAGTALFKDIASVLTQERPRTP
jgi:4-alpha-glucanotransferase